ncbi:Verru_Chthon cassette protein D [Verrucomicrobiales bacterium BCK34]|nr:Verru_Chthon cassette protein D [Verrucomicrobiales bacterium BCK34]
MKSTGPSHAVKAAGFSLIEILAVLTIISLLLSMSVMGINRVTEATDLTNNGDQIVNQLVQARQRAIADNAHVEVRVYPPPEDNRNKEWTLVLARQGLDETPATLQQPLILSESIAISEDRDFSTLIAARKAEKDEGLIRTASGTEQKYHGFKFHPDGSTNLPINPNGDTWHLTAASRKDLERNKGTLPDNFYTIRVDPFTGAVRSFRP